jgi:hypothetical protein
MLQPRLYPIKYCWYKSKCITPIFLKWNAVRGRPKHSFLWITRGCLVSGHNYPSQSLAIWHVFGFAILLGCYTLLSIWLTYHGVNLLLTFATLYGFKILSHTFVAPTHAKFRLTKVCLGTKQNLRTQIRAHNKLSWVVGLYIRVPNQVILVSLTKWYWLTS